MPIPSTHHIPKPLSTTTTSSSLQQQQYGYPVATPPGGVIDMKSSPSKNFRRIVASRSGSQQIPNSAVEERYLHLPAEICERIVEAVGNDRSALHALSLLNRTLYAAALPRLYREVSFDSFYSLHQFLQPRTLALARDLTRSLRFTNLRATSSLTDAHLAALGESLPNVDAIQLSWCHKIGDAGFAAALAASGASWRCVRLDRSHKITDATLREIATQIGDRLEVLSIGHLSNVSDAGLAEIAMRCPNLRYLNAECCERITDRSLTLVVSRCRKLELLNARLAHLGESTLTELHKQPLPLLRELNLVRFSQDFSLELLHNALSAQPSLEQLTVSLDSELCAENAARMFRECPSLRRIHLSRCDKVEPQQIAELAQRNWDIRANKNTEANPNFLSQIVRTVDLGLSMPSNEDEHIRFI